MSLHLNERELREKTVDAVPMSEVALTAAAVPAPYALRLLGVLADRSERTGPGISLTRSHLAFVVVWLSSLGLDRFFAFKIAHCIGRSPTSGL